MLGFIATEALLHEMPTGPTVDPITYAHPSRALALAQAYATEGEEETAPADVLAVMWIVHADPDEWAPACEDCLRAVGQPHDCTGVTGPVRALEAILMHANRVRT